MHRRMLFFFLVLRLVSSAQTYFPTKENLAARNDFQDMKFGMFIHWGPSSILGNGEWVMQNRGIRTTEYRQLLDLFNPTKFNAKEWVTTAKSAGMKYITFITRHHDGFSNWDTRYSDWKITNTPYQKDVLKLLSAECKVQGIKLFLYYSLLDWYRSDYQFSTGKTGKNSGREKQEDWNQYIQFMKDQLTELLTQYGEIAGVWLDGHWDQLENDHDKTLASKVDWHYPEIYQLIHQLQPKCLISNNHHLTPIAGEDFQAFEKDLPGNNTTGFGGAAVSALPLETCETMNDTWGYHIADRKFKTTKSLVHYLVKAAANNANFLLNVGPMPSGKIQVEFTDTLAAIGKWTTMNGKSIYGTRGNVLPEQAWGVFTGNTKYYYAHILNPNAIQQAFIFVPKINNKIESIHLLNSTKSIQFKQQPEGLFIYLEGVAFEEIDTILEIEFKASL